MDDFALDEALFFDPVPGAYSIYRSLKDAIPAAWPGRWTTHIVVGPPEEIGGELLRWVGESYDFAAGKRQRQEDLFERQNEK